VRTTTTTATMAAAMIPRTMSLRSKATVERISSSKAASRASGRVGGNGTCGGPASGGSRELLHRTGVFCAPADLLGLLPAHVGVAQLFDVRGEGDGTQQWAVATDVDEQRAQEAAPRCGSRSFATQATNMHAESQTKAKRMSQWTSWWVTLNPTSPAPWWTSHAKPFGKQV